MAKRLCFFVHDDCIEEKYVEFEYVKGMAFSQKVKCATSLQNKIKEQYPEFNPLEVSTKSTNDVGKRLSAFNLKLHDNYFESVFQSSKVFNGEIQYIQLLDFKPSEAKKFIKENTKGELIGFKYMGTKYPLNPKSAFYDWLYIHAVLESSDSSSVLQFDAFTDIEFNDKVSINCQARAIAIYVLLKRLNKLEFYLSSFDNFIGVYKLIEKNTISLFD